MRIYKHAQQFSRTPLDVGKESLRACKTKCGRQLYCVMALEGIMVIMLELRNLPAGAYQRQIASMFHGLCPDNFYSHQASKGVGFEVVGGSTWRSRRPYAELWTYHAS